jgi:hypothetical protein
MTGPFRSSLEKRTDETAVAQEKVGCLNFCLMCDARVEAIRVAHWSGCVCGGVDGAIGSRHDVFGFCV